MGGGSGRELVLYIYRESEISRTPPPFSGFAVDFTGKTGMVFLNFCYFLHFDLRRTCIFDHFFIFWGGGPRQIPENGGGSEANHL